MFAVCSATCFKVIITNVSLQIISAFVHKPEFRSVASHGHDRFVYSLIVTQVLSTGEAVENTKVAKSSNAALATAART